MTTSREVAHERMSAAFNEWMRRYTEAPEEFLREWQAVQQYLAEKAAGKEPTYGDTATAYFVQLLDAIPV